MLKITNTDVLGFEQAIYSMRNPKNSWARSDSWYDDNYFKLGENDLKLATTLANAGTEHGKYLRMINVYFDVVAPLYWMSELDTYKIGTVRNSCSFMHKGTSKPFTIKDFSIKNEKVYEVLNDLEKKDYTVTFPYETEEYKDYTDPFGNSYKVYRNGKIVANAFDYVDNYGTGRSRHFEEREMKVFIDKGGYCSVKLIGRHHGHLFVHRIVAEAWNLPRVEGQTQIDHLDTNKGNNSVENLQWVTPSENMQRAIKHNLYDNLDSLHKKYKTWKTSHVIPLEDRVSFLSDCHAKFTCTELAEKYNITSKQANELRYNMLNNIDNEYLFNECYVWEQLINTLNSLRDEYLITNDLKVFQNIRCLLPQGYLQRSTFMMNYATLKAIYHQRKNHKLDEWHTFCEWVETLPYAKELIIGEEV